MDETLRQLGELLLRSIPTMIFFLVVYFGYRLLVHSPLLKVLDERHAKTQGALEKARADVAAAEAKTAEYEQRLRESKVAVFKAQEARRQQAVAARTEILNQARDQAAAKVAEARKAIGADVQAAKAALQADSERLATQVIDRVLSPAALAGGAR
jgi:F-type H+-transporting ATPase subunit b